VGVVSASPRRYLTLAILAIATVAVGHDLVYVLAHGTGPGYGRAMDSTGHGSYWASFVLTATLLAGGLAGISAWQLWRLARRARSLEVRLAGVPDAPIGLLCPLAWSWWRPVFAASTAWFLVQENLEQVVRGNAAPLLGALTGDHWLAVPVLALVSLAIAAAAALVAWRRGALLARLAAAGRPWPRRTIASFGIARDVRPRRRALSAGHALRAPPLGSVRI